MAKLTHFDDSGASRMVNISGKPLTERIARAEALVHMNPKTYLLIQNRDLAKGDVLEVARLAGIMATKKTSDLIPLCHPIGLMGARLDFEMTPPDCLRIEAQVSTTGQTGVEMEALTAVSIAAMTVYDMCKSVDRGMEVSRIRLLEKAGGESGHFLRETR